MTAEKPIRIAIAGGGTGGHVLPAVSVIEEIRRRGLDVEYLWIGSASGIERDRARELGIPFKAVSVGKLRRYLDLKTITDAMRIPIGIVQAFRIVHAFRPDVIFSTGGFVSVPTVVAGSRRAPVLTHEQTTILGLATKINAKFADVLALSYEQTRGMAEGVKAKVVVTGNPVRGSLACGDPTAARAQFGFGPDLPFVYVTGGARGASPINQRVEAMLPTLLDTCCLLHQTGPAGANDDAARLRTLRSTWTPKLQARFAVTEFVGGELRDVFAAADLVVARSGAGTVAELAFLGKPAVLIPLPGSGGGEQDVNAKTLAAAGAAVVIPQPDATPERLAAEIDALLSDPSRRAKMSAAARSLARPDAAANLTDQLLALARH